MKLNTLTNVVLAAVATAGMSTVAFAEDNARFEAQMTVDSVNNCQFTVTPENGTAMTATYKYTAADQAAGTFGTTTLDTTAPLTVLVSAGGDNCKLGRFTVSTGNPGVTIGHMLAGIPTHDGGRWPVRWLYSFFDSYKDAEGHTPIDADTVLWQAFSGITTYSRATTKNAGAPAAGWHVVINRTVSNAGYGDYDGGWVPALSTAPDGGHIRWVRNGEPMDLTCVSASRGCAGMQGVAANGSDGVTAMGIDVTPADGAASVRIGLAQLIATIPYSTALRAPDPLTVFDTNSGNGTHLSATSTMTVTAL